MVLPESVQHNEPSAALVEETQHPVMNAFGFLYSQFTKPRTQTATQGAIGSSPPVLRRPMLQQLDSGDNGTLDSRS